METRSRLFSLQEGRKMSKKKSSNASTSLPAYNANAQVAQPEELAILSALENLKGELLAKIEEKADSQNVMTDHPQLKPIT